MDAEYRQVSEKHNLGPCWEKMKSVGQNKACGHDFATSRKKEPYNGDKSNGEIGYSGDKSNGEIGFWSVLDVGPFESTRDD